MELVNGPFNLVFKVGGALKGVFLGECRKKKGFGFG